MKWIRYKDGGDLDLIFLNKVEMATVVLPIL